MKNALIAKIHIAKKDMCLDDGTYRMIIKQASGKDSCSKCSIIQLEKILDFMKSKGWKPSQPKKVFRKPPTDLIAKIYALWGNLQEIGAVKSTEKTSLDEFVKRHTGIHSVQWIEDKQAVKIIEMLKKWQKRVSKKEADNE